jgi:hypothetical protein
MNVELPNVGARPPDAPESGASDPLDRIAIELAALGEPDLEIGDELPAIGAPFGETAVLTAFALSYPVAATTTSIGPTSIGVAGLAPLSDLDRKRVWRKIEARRAPRSSPPHVEHTHAAASSWRASFVAFAMAAGLVLVPMLWPAGAPKADAGDRAKTVMLGQQARAALDGLPGDRDGARASSLAAGYAARLDAERGGVR